MKFRLKLCGVIATVAYTWGTMANVMAHHEGTQTGGSGGGLSTLGAIIGGSIAVGIIGFIMFWIWDKKLNTRKKLRKGRRRGA